MEGQEVLPGVTGGGRGACPTCDCPTVELRMPISFSARFR